MKKYSLLANLYPSKETNKKQSIYSISEVLLNEGAGGSQTTDLKRDGSQKAAAEPSFERKISALGDGGSAQWKFGQHLVNSGKATWVQCVKGRGGADVLIHDSATGSTNPPAVEIKHLESGAWAASKIGDKAVQAIWNKKIPKKGSHSYGQVMGQSQWLEMTGPFKGYVKSLAGTIKEYDISVSAKGHFQKADKSGKLVDTTGDYMSSEEVQNVLDGIEYLPNDPNLPAGITGWKDVFDSMDPILAIPKREMDIKGDVYCVKGFGSKDGIKMKPKKAIEHLRNQKTSKFKRNVRGYDPSTSGVVIYKDADGGEVITYLDAYRGDGKSGKEYIAPRNYLKKIKKQKLDNFGYITLPMGITFNELIRGYLKKMKDDYYYAGISNKFVGGESSKLDFLPAHPHASLKNSFYLMDDKGNGRTNLCFTVDPKSPGYDEVDLNKVALDLFHPQVYGYTKSTQVGQKVDNIFKDGW